MLKPKGTVFIKREMIKTTFPEPNLLSETIDNDYREALSGKLCLVMDICVADTGYLVLSKHKNHGDFLWHVEKEDTIAFLPIANINGKIVNCSKINDPLEAILNDLEGVFLSDDINLARKLFSKVFKK